MSQDNENKPDEFDFDNQAADQGNGHGNPFSEDDFNPFADDTPSAMPDGSEADSPDASPFDFGGMDFPAFDEPSSNEILPEHPKTEEITQNNETPDIESEFSENDLSAPSGFLAENSSSDMIGNIADPEQSESVDQPNGFAESPGIDLEKGKKEKKNKKEKKPKKEKKKKEKAKKSNTPKEKSGSMGVGAVLSLVLTVLLFIGLIAFNVLTVLDPPEGVGMTSTIYYLVGVNVFGIFAVSVPFLFFIGRERPGTDTPPEKKIDLFKVALGTSVIAMSFGVILLMTTLYRYDFETKPAGSLPSLSMPNPEPNQGQ